MIMTLKELINMVNETAASVPGIHLVQDGDVYNILNNKQVVYSAVVTTPVMVNPVEDVDQVDVVVYYVDRMVQDGSNYLDIQSNAIIALSTLAHYISELDDIYSCDMGLIEVFTQKFADYCAGAYCTFTISIKNNRICGL